MNAEGLDCEQRPQVFQSINAINDHMLAKENRTLWGKNLLWPSHS